MQLLARSFGERDPVRVGIVGVSLLAVLALLLFNGVAIYRAVTQSSYTAIFAEAGGLRDGAKVRLNGADVGKVKKVRLQGERVAVEFSVKKVGRLGRDTRAGISAESVLGVKYLSITPQGPGELEPDAVIPIERTNSPYDVSEALSTLTAKSADIDKDQLAKALNTVSETLKDTPAPLRSTLEGVGRISQTIATRDVALRELLAHAQSVTQLLANRSGDIVSLVGEGRQLLAELNRRRDAIEELLVNVTETINQLDGLADDNRKQLKPALDDLRDTLDLLNRNDKNLASVIHGLNVYAGSLGEAVGGGPWFYAFIKNLNDVPGPLGGLISSLPGPRFSPAPFTPQPGGGGPTIPVPQIPVPSIFGGFGTSNPLTGGGR
jgi:phospholipid/cholesterol/gamma-HCH transport system substrate-binding protein